MYCYYCGNIIDEEKNTCTRCGKAIKEIQINLDSLNIQQESITDNQDNETFENVVNDILEETASDDKTEKNTNESSKPATNKVKIKIKPKKK